MASGQLAVNARHVVHETIDDETILIHLGTGAYYSLDQSGTAVWSLASRGMPPEEVVATIAAAHDAPHDVVAEGVGALIDRLVEGVELRTRRPRSPSAEGMGDDPRLFGLCVSELVLEPRRPAG